MKLILQTLYFTLVVVVVMVVMVMIPYKGPVGFINFLRK